MSFYTDIYNHAKTSLPRFLFADPSAKQEVLWAYAMMMDSAKFMADYWISQATITKSEGVWLDGHAKDRGAFRQVGEYDQPLATRIRTTEDAVTPGALKNTVDSIIATQDAGGDGWASALVELRKDRGFTGTSGGKAKTFLSRGYRVGTSGRPMTFIFILPYGISVNVQAAISDYLRTRKAAGYKHTTELRGIP